MVKVITYGTYDLLHYGHIRLLERAKALGDYLIVGVTSDAYDKERGKINGTQSVLERVEAVKKTGLAAVVENHSIIGGLGSAICEMTADKYPTKVYRIGINDEFGQSGSANDLLKFYGLDSDSLAEKFKTIYNNNKQGN